MHAIFTLHDALSGLFVCSISALTVAGLSGKAANFYIYIHLYTVYLTLSSG